MEYKKYIEDGYNLHLINTNKFKSVIVKINFKRQLKKEEMSIRNLLVNVLVDSSKKFKTKKEIEIETEELYGLSGGTDITKSGNCSIFSFSINFLNEKYTEPNMLKKSIEFLIETAFNPNIENEAFNDNSFDIAKRIVKNEINSLKDSPNSYSRQRMLEILNIKSPRSYRKSGYIKDLNKINSHNLYEHYKDMIDNDIVDIFVIGEIDFDEVKSIFKDLLKLNKRNKNNINHYIIETTNKIKTKKEHLLINQSRLMMCYNFNEITDFELKYVLNLLSFILGGSGDSKLFKNVREKESLCYNISSSYDILSGLLVISAGIDKDKTKRTIELINDEIKNMQQGNFSLEDIENGKKIYKNSCIELFDSQSSIINMYISHEYMNSDLVEEKIKKIDTVKKEDIISLANKLHLNTTFILEGDLANENEY